MGDAVPNLGGTDTLTVQANGSANLSTATAGNVSITSRGKDIGSYTVTMQNTVAAGAETVVWTATGVTISKAVTSTAAQVVAAAGGVTSAFVLQWGTLAATGTTSTAIPDTYTIVTVKDLWSYVPGYLKTSRD